MYQHIHTTYNQDQLNLLQMGQQSTHRTHKTTKTCTNDTNEHEGGLKEIQTEGQ